jgi:hypothetical protein
MDSSGERGKTGSANAGAAGQNEADNPLQPSGRAASSKIGPHG